MVLGAGIVGTCTAIHLALRGYSVTLLDRKAPGSETSYGNSGIIQREAVEPYGFPQDLRILREAAFKIGARVNYHFDALPGLAPDLLRYWSNSRPGRHARLSKHHAKLIECCLDEHELLIGMSGAGDLVGQDGFRFVYRSQATMDSAIDRAQRLAREYGVSYSIQDRHAIAQLEPALKREVAGALHWLDPWRIKNPGELVSRYAELFLRQGGHIVQGDANTLHATSMGWGVASDAGRVDAEAAVIALGPWSAELARKFGYGFPLLPIRGYHRHYLGTGPQLPMVDADGGYMIAPMQQGWRITTGAEFARLEAPSTPVQLTRAEILARELFELPQAVESEPWRGARPCMVDLLPVMGAATRHRGLWFNFGHAHQGFTLGPVSGRLIAELMSGSTPLLDPAPYSPARFS
ncbi:NAD(P)/FAD-dependent oxidoreductase [Paracandidimonas soli]|uniref:NAD(P)/FAD-dependent oxidoreductase n=1 Tax=Paracandidimonas soli TaxID=1917182 RepID=UPI00361944C9